VIVLAAAERFWAVCEWYDDFRQTDDAEVMRLLGR
jgi:predicted phosphoribosyltransferase